MTIEEKIENARSAAPLSVSGEATILDWPAEEGGEFPVLVEGTNGWTCLPDMPDTEGNDPECADAMWMKFFEAYFAHETPSFERVGVSYMIAPGGSPSSNLDPFAKAPTDDNEWGFDVPHIMILVPNLDDLEGLPTKRESGGPWVMWPGTPYAHIMVPIVDRNQGQ